MKLPPIRLALLLLLGGFSASAFAAPPNILFAIADDWSPHAGAYGTPWVKTPAFDRVAKEGLLFRHAYTPNAKCAPSRACLLTGRNSWQLEEAANHICYFPAKFKGWGEALDRLPLIRWTRPRKSYWMAPSCRSWFFTALRATSLVL